MQLNEVILTGSDILIVAPAVATKATKATKASKAPTYQGCVDGFSSPPYLIGEFFSFHKE